MDLKAWRERARRLKELAERGLKEGLEGERVVRQAVERLERWFAEASGEQVLPASPPEAAGSRSERPVASRMAREHGASPPEATGSRSERPVASRMAPEHGASPRPDASAGGAVSEPEREPPPVATATLARLLASQGHLALAVEVADQVLAGSPDADLAEARRAWVARLGAGAHEPDPSPKGGCRLDPLPEGGVACGWNLEPADLRRAERLLDGGGEARLVLRLVHWRATEAGALCREESEWAVEAFRGARDVSELPSGCHVVASVGLRRGERFVSAAHAGPVRAR